MIAAKIKENSWVARLAAKYLKAYSAAIVFGNTIHLHNSSQQNFLADTRWLRHEAAHIKQYERLGFFRFLILYATELLINGYHNNKFEAEAREKENDPTVLANINFM